MERTRPLEFRAAGRTLTGPAVRYGEVAADRRERFEARSLRSMDDPLPLRLQHDPAITVATTADRLAITDTAASLDVRAELLPGAALDLVERRALRGLSLEFHALAERRDGDGLRVIEGYHLAGIGLVDVGSYAGSTVELRARMGRTLMGTIPTGRRLACECTGSARWAEVDDAWADTLADVFDQYASDFAEDSNDIIAAFGSYDRPLASASSGTLRVRRTDDGVAVDIDLPDDEAGRAVVAAQESAGVVVRPYIDDEFVTRTELPDGGVRYSAGTGGGGSPVRAFIVSSTDRREGWPTPSVNPTPDLETRASGLAVPRRRRLLPCL